MPGQKSASDEPRTPIAKVPRTRKVGDAAALRSMDWAILRTAYRAVKVAATFSEQMSALHAYNQLSGGYKKTLEVTALTDEISALRAELAELKTADTDLRKVV